MAAWITGPVAERCPNAELLLRSVPRRASSRPRRSTRSAARSGTRRDAAPGLTALAGELKGARFALWKNPENLTDRQAGQARADRADKPATLSAPTSSRSNCARSTGSRAAQAAELARGWLIWARRCRLDRSSSSPGRSPTARPGSSPPSPRPLQRPRRSDQHPDPTDHPPRLRLPHPRSAHRPRDAHTRRALPTTPADDTTHGNVRRVQKPAQQSPSSARRRWPLGSSGITVLPGATGSSSPIRRALTPSPAGSPSTATALPSRRRGRHTSPPDRRATWVGKAQHAVALPAGYCLSFTRRRCGRGGGRS